MWHGPPFLLDVLRNKMQSTPYAQSEHTSWRSRQDLDLSYNSGDTDLQRTNSGHVGERYGSESYHKWLEERNSRQVLDKKGT